MIKAIKDGDLAGDAFAGLNQAIRTANSFRRSNVLTRRMFGRYRTVTVTTPQTTHMLMEMTSHFRDVQIGIPNLAQAQVAGVKVCVGLVAEFGSNDPAGSWLNLPNIDTPWIDLTFGGAATATLAAAGATDDTLTTTWSDPVALRSLLRTYQGRTRPILAIRVEHPANVPITVPYGDFYNWANIDQYTNHRMTTGTQAVAGVTDKNAYTKNNATYVDSCIPMVRYTVKKAGIQVQLAGDSTLEGTGAQVRAYGSVVRACHEMSTVDLPIEVYNGAINGATAPIFTKHLAATIGEARPNVVFVMGYSTNDDPGGLVADEAITRAWGALGTAFRAIRQQGRPPLVFLLGTNPKNAAAKALGASDANRRSFNGELGDFTEAVYVPNYVESVTGARLASGQDEMKAGYSNDNVHLNDVGYDAQSPSVKAVLALV